MLAVTRQIAEHPYLGHLRPDIGTERLRFLLLTGYPYLAVYEPEPAPPLILRILHGARDLPAVLRELTPKD